VYRRSAAGLSWEMVLRSSCRVAIALAGWLAVAVPALGQETLARAKDYYASANYEEALDVLRRIRPSAPNEEAREIAVYQLFCLLALGRNDETRKAIETIVRTDPLYHLSDEDASPRVRTLFENIRKPLLPDIVKEAYGKAKAAFDRKDMPEAAAGFDKVLALLDDAAVAEAPGVADLRTLATGFRDLIKLPPAAPPPAPDSPPPALANTPASQPAAAANPDTPRIYGVEDKTVVRPIPISNPLPPWRPSRGIDSRQEFDGNIELIIDEAGKVVSSQIRKSVHREYDPVLLEASRSWTFRPATVNGTPVKYRYVLQVNLKPGETRSR
jgi:tetratricopeptide (TPR) repeat protein